jgi:secondary thiamine-phosphate synthase enzyme
MVHQETLILNTAGHGAMRDLTQGVGEVVRRSGIKRGIAHVFNVGSTAGVGTIEFEPGLMLDLPALMDRLIPAEGAYGHEKAWQDGNAHGHLQATLLGPSVTVPVGEGRLLLGTWQQVFHFECDVRPRRREIVVTVYGE